MPRVHDTPQDLPFLGDGAPREATGVGSAQWPSVPLYLDIEGSRSRGRYSISRDLPCLVGRVVCIGVGSGPSRILRPHVALRRGAKGCRWGWDHEEAS